MGFVQEYRTEKTLEALKEMAAPAAQVIRDGEVVSVPASQMVVGDVFLLKAGDRVPADALILSSTNLYADESLLSGESEPVEKHPAKTLETDFGPGKLEAVYMGTVITKGRGKACLLYTSSYDSFDLLDELGAKNLLDGVELYYPGTSPEDFERIAALSLIHIYRGEFQEGFPLYHHRAGRAGGLF